MAKNVEEVLPKICRNDKKKEVLRKEHLLMERRGPCAYCRICAAAIVTAIAVPVKFW
jgi:hypothetical protein